MEKVVQEKEKKQEVIVKKKAFTFINETKKML